MNDEPESEPGVPDPSPDTPSEGDSGPAPADAPAAPPAGVPEPPAEAAPPAFRRAGSDRYLGGVAAGLGRALGVDATIVRVGLAVATVFWSIVPLVYAAVWLTVPEEGADRSLLRSMSRPGGLRRVVSVTALGVGATVVASGLRGSGAGMTRLGLVLLGAGLILILGRPSPEGWTAGPDTEQVSGPARPERPPASDGPAPAPPLLGSRLPFAGRRRPPGTWLGWLCLSLVALVGGAALGLDLADVAISPGWVVVLSLAIVAAGLLVGAYWGRARLLIPVGLLLVPAWVGFSLSDIPRYEDEGRVVHRPLEIADLQEEYTHGYGRLVVDLTQLTLPEGETRELDLGLTAGEIEVRVPYDVEVGLSGEVGLGGSTVKRVWEGRHTYFSEELASRSEGFLAGRRVSTGSPARAPTCEPNYRDPRFYDEVDDWPDDFGPGEPGPWPDDLPPDRPVPEPGPWSDDLPPDRPVPEPGPRVPTPRDTDPDGLTCSPEPAPENPPVVEIDVRLGVGHVEVRHVETPA